LTPLTKDVIELTELHVFAVSKVSVLLDHF
jgi:hypothetical protein